MQELSELAQTYIARLEKRSAELLNENKRLHAQVAELERRVAELTDELKSAYDSAADDIAELKYGPAD